MALEWLKGILGEAYTDDIDKAVSAEIGKGFVSKTDFNTLNDTKKTLEKENGDLKKVDSAALQTQVDQLTKDNAALKLGRRLDAALMKAKAHDVTAVGALLDMSKISLDEGGKLVGADEQIKALQQSQAWAFDQTTVPGAGGNPPAADASIAEEAKMRAAAGLPETEKTV